MIYQSVNRLADLLWVYEVAGTLKEPQEPWKGGPADTDND